MKIFVLCAVLLVCALAPAPAGAIGAAGGGPPSVGAAAPDFSLTSDLGKPTGLKDFHGRWVVLYFYPKDFTGGCTLEAHNFQRDAAKYEERGAVVLGVSVDSADSHKSFCAKEGLGFTLLSDPGGKVSTMYGSVMQYEGATYSERNTFLIDPQGTIARVFTKVDPKGHSDEILAAIASLQKH